MAQTLSLMGRSADALWRKVAASSPGGEWLDFSAQAGGVGADVYPWNVWGWRRWLRRRPIERIDWYEPDRISWSVVWAAQWEGIPVQTHITSVQAADWLRRHRRWLGRKMRYITPLSAWIQRAGIDAAHAQVQPVRFDTHARDKECSVFSHKNDIYGCTAGETEQPVRLLAVSQPGEKGLRPAVWTASMVRYVAPWVQLVIVGRASSAQQERIKTWERMWGSEGMCLLAGQTPGWESVMAACDVVLATGAGLEGYIRLACAHAAGCCIIAPAGECEGIWSASHRMQFVKHACAREFSRAVLDMTGVKEHRC